ncbi:protein FAM210B, mitochondrial [Discoglossus pictus]
MLCLSGLLLSRGSVLRPGWPGAVSLCARGMYAGPLRLRVLRDPAAVRPALLARPCPMMGDQGVRWVSGKELGQESSDSTGKATSDPPNDNGKKPNKTQQLKKVFKEYGAVAVSFHVGISLVSLGIFYVIVSSGLDITSLLLKIGFSEAVVQSKMAAGTSTFVLAYAIHKLFAPARISITLVSVPFIVRYLRRIGLFKPPTKAV